MADKLAMMLLTLDPERPHLCGTPFFQAAAAASMDVDVEVYFSSRAVRLLVKGVADRIYPGESQHKTVYEFMRDAAKLGVKFYACGGGLPELGVKEEDFIPECTGMAGAAAYIQRVMDDEWKVLSY
jgi:predicted peroxiredoxin